MTSIETFELNDPLPLQEWLLLEASAGTGKTYSLTAMVARYVAEYGLRSDELLMVTFTRAAAAEMKHEVRQQLLRARDALDAAESVQLDAWLQQLRDCTDTEKELRRTRLEAAISTIDSATISTIHGFFQQALGDLGLRSGETNSPSPAESDTTVANKVVRDALVRRFAADAKAFDPSGSKNPGSIEAQVTKTLKSTSGNLAAQLAPSRHPVPLGGVWAEAIHRFKMGLTGVDLDAALEWTDFLDALRAEIKAERSVQGVVAFDDVITDLIDKLDDPELGPELTRALRDRYRLVLIDEFQDTDTFQWKLFSSVFDLAGVPEEFLAMIVVGDPKQAIYRFRGADIDAYLEVAENGSMAKRQMTTNYRTDRPLVTALNDWLTDTTFGSPTIGYVPVTTPESHGDARLRNGGEPLQFRFLANPDKRTAEPVRAAIALDVADHIQRLLAEGEIVTGVAGSSATRRVKLEDICILVRGHDDARPLVEELRRRHIPVVRSRIGSVLDSDAVDQLRLLLWAMANPGDVRRVRALQLTWFAPDPAFGADTSSEASAIDVVKQLQTKCRSWSNELETRGLLGWYQLLRLDQSVINELSSDYQAERRLTDLEHIIELLHAHLGGRRAPVSAVLRALDELESTMNDDADAQKRRIDTDRDVIQITTMHSAKGLEYPIVLLPFPKGTPKSSVSSYLDNEIRYVDGAPSVPWILNGLTKDERELRDRREAMGDELRLLYVALTRAQHQLVIWWGRSARDTALTGPLARVLFGSTSELDDDVVIDDAGARSAIATLVDRLGPAAGFTELSVWENDREWPAPTQTVTDPLQSAAFPDRSIDRDGWYRWSYSSLSKGARASNEGNARGGFDEPAHVPAGDLDATGSRFTGPLLGMQASAEFGTFVHELFEHLDLGAGDLDAEVRAVIDASGRAQTFDADPELLAQGILDVVATPLGDSASSPTLRSVGSDRLSELVFHFPLAGGERTIATSELFDLAASFTDDLFSDYFAELAASNRMTSMAGLLTGSIDSVLRSGHDEATRYGVVDYKTNRLHIPGDSAFVSDYGAASMKHAMEHGDYPLQILVYNVALHRMLQMRLADYDIDRDLGPTHYLFVRGMIGGPTPVVDGVRNGVFSWRPSSDLIRAASRLLGGLS